MILKNYKEYKLDDFRIINTLENGDCLFEAAGVGLCLLIMMGLLDDNAAAGKYDRFIKNCAANLNIEPTWAALKEYIETNKKDTKLIQLAFAPILRELVSHEKKLAAPSIHIEQPDSDTRIEAIQAEFRDYVFKELKLKHDENYKGGDIFNKHEKITAKFQELYKLLIEDLKIQSASIVEDFKAALKNNGSSQGVTEKELNIINEVEKATKKQNAALVTWFKNEGYSLFLDQMGQRGAWGGDTELKEIKEYFEIAMIAYNHQRGFMYPIGTFHGTLPSKDFTLDEIELLISRNIIDKDISDGQIHFCDLTFEELEGKLEVLSNSDALYEDWNSKKGLVHKPLSDNHLPYVTQLLDRGIIAKDNQGEGYHYISDLKRERLIFKMKAFEKKEEFIEKWKAAYTKKPVIFLSNPSASHWYFLQPIETLHIWDLSAIDVTNTYLANEAMRILFALSVEFLNTRWQNNESPKINFGVTPEEYTSALIPPQNELDELFFPEGTAIKASASDEYSSINNFLQDRIFSNLKEDEEELSNFPSDDIPYGEVIGRISPLIMRERQKDITYDANDDSDRDDGVMTPPDSGNEVKGTASRGKSISSSFWRSPVDTPLSTSPTGYSPPPKRAKSISENRSLKNAAGSAAQKLKELKSDHELINRLIWTYYTAYTTGDIAKRASCFLIDPAGYANLKNLPIKNRMPQEVIDFSQKFLCEMIHLSKKEFTEQFLLHYKWLINHLKDDVEDNNEIFSFLNKINDIIVAEEFTLDMLKEGFESFNFGGFDQIEKLLTQSSPNENLTERVTEIKEFLGAYELVFSKFSPKACAQSVLLLLQESIDASLDSFKEIFKAVEMMNDESKFYELQQLQIDELLAFRSDDCEFDYGIAKGIESFVKLFKHELNQVRANLSYNMI